MYIFPDPFNLTILENLVRQIVPLANQDETTAEFWIRLHNIQIGGEYRYRDITTGVIKMLCLPFSNAEVERVFSATTYYKSGRRCGLSTEMLEAILYCKFGINWLGIKISEFVPPLEMLNYNSSLLYEK